MNQNHKHTPLSPEELVKLLEHRSNNEPDLSELDDFEKEAFEGFSAHTSPIEAKKLMDEIQSDISKKASYTLINEQADSSKKNKIIWFSAAASLVLIIGLSVLFIKKSDVTTAQSLALNEAKLKQEPSPTPPEITTTTATESKPEIVSAEGKADKQSEKSNTNIQQTVSNELSIATVSKGAGKSAENTGPISRGLVNKPSTKDNSTGYAYDNSVSANSKDKNTNTDVEKISRESNNSNNKEQDDLSKNQSGERIVLDEVASIPASANAVTKAEEEKNISLVSEKSLKSKTDAKKESSKQPVSLAETNPDSYREEANADGDRMESESRAYTTTAQNTKATKSTQNTVANYVGGEASIKDYILTYSKKINSTKKLQGTFMIIATIKKDGTLKVISINNVSKDYSNCKDFLKEALNTMKKWNPAITNGNKVDSETQFTIIF